MTTTTTTFELLAEFWVPGKPKPAGSKTPTALRRKDGSIQMTTLPNGKTRPVIIMRDDSDNAEWKQAARVAYMQARTGAPLVGAPIRLSVDFYMPRPKDHYRKRDGRLVLSEDIPEFHLQTPDATKLLRCIEDALSGYAWEDDDCVVLQVVSKGWEDGWEGGRGPGAMVRIEIIRSEACQGPLFVPAGSRTA